MILRARHLLCISGYFDGWYDEISTLKMESLRHEISRNPHIILKITHDCDDICTACPHYHMQHCHKDKESHKYFQERDDLVLTTLHVEHDISYRLEELSRCISRYIQKSDIEYTCGQCQWSQACFAYQKYIS